MTDTTKVDAVSQRLRRLSALCDSGFALAIHIRYTRPSLLYRTYAQDWIDTYSERGYMLSDPVVVWGLSHTGVVVWEKLAAQDPQGVLADAKAHGLLNGWTYATGPATSRTIAGLTSTKALSPQESADIIAIVDELHTLTEGFAEFSAEVQNSLIHLG